MYFNQYSNPMGIGNIGNIGNYPTYSMPNFQSQVQSAQQTPTQNMEWIPVNGIEGAKNHIVGRNETAWLMDNNDSKFYVKTADNLGVTTLKAYQFTEIDVNSNSKTFLNETQVNLQDYVKRTEIEELIENKLQEIAKSELKKGGNKNG